MGDRALVIVPTYNEKENLTRLISAVLAQDESIDVLIVDDGSPDGTGDIADAVARENPRVHAIHRASKLGLGTAYVAGFRWALARDYEFIFEMDADFSHSPERLPAFLEAIRNADLVLGSRYQNGQVNVVNWPMGRLFLSYSANIYARRVTGLPIFDSTGGFKCFRRRVLESIDLGDIKSNGYAFQIEMTVRAWRKGFRIMEIPIVFVDRTEGSSKMSKRIVREAVWMVWRLRWWSLRGSHLSGRSFHKMSGSGNDFVFFNLADGPAGDLESPEMVRALSARGTGVGSDGVVFLDPLSRDSFAIRYYNSDGSLGELCGNATLCALRLAHDIGMVSGDEVAIQTDAGVVKARMVDGLPEIDLAPVSDVQLSVSEIPRLDREDRLGFALAGVPHVVIVARDVQSVDVARRGSEVRRHPSLRHGANVNFLTPNDRGWVIRTYERGVESETLACGTGAVASGILLTEWGRADSPVRLRTKSGKELEVRVRKEGNEWLTSLRGSAELVFIGELRMKPAVVVRGDAQDD